MNLFRDLQGKTIKDIWRMDHDPDFDADSPEALHLHFDHVTSGLTIRLVDDDETIIVRREPLENFINYFGTIYINEFKPATHFSFKGQPLIDVKIGVYKGPLEVTDGAGQESEYSMWAVKVFLAGGSFYFYNSGDEGCIEFNPVDEPPVIVPLQWL